MNVCPDQGAWRAWLDGEPTEPPLEAGHLDECPACTRTVADLRADAAQVATAMSKLEPVSDRAQPDHPTRSRIRRRMEVAAGVAAFAVFVATPFGQDAAQAFLSSFRVERLSLVTITTAEAVQTAQTLEALGTIDGGEAMQAPSIAADTTEAASITGLTLPVPAGEGAPDRVLTLPAATIRWTLDSDRIARHLAFHKSDLAIPPGLDGTTLVLERAAAVVGLWGSSDAPDLIVGISGPVTASAENGVSLDEARDFLLSIPGLPAGLVAQLRSIDDWRSTLPIPLPIDDGSAREVRLGSVDAVSFRAEGVGSGYLWTKDGTIVGVASPDNNNLADIATELAR